MFPSHLRVSPFIKANSRDPHTNGFVDIGQQAPIVSDTRQEREVGFCNTEGEVRTLGLTPRDHWLPVHDDGARHRAARVHRPK